MRVDPEVNVDQDMPTDPVNEAPRLVGKNPADVFGTSMAAPEITNDAPIVGADPQEAFLDHGAFGAMSPLPGDPLYASSLGGDRIAPVTPIPPFAPASLQLASIEPREVDQLWDWVRADRDSIMNFLGFIPPNALALYQWIENFKTLERDGRARFHAIYVAGSLAGFVMLCPIQNGVADCHLYLSIDARGKVRSLLPLIITELDRLTPGLSLRVVVARDEEWARLLRGVGFVAQIVLTRPAAVMTGNASGS